MFTSFSPCPDGKNLLCIDEDRNILSLSMFRASLPFSSVVVLVWITNGIEESEQAIPTLRFDDLDELRVREGVVPQFQLSEDRPILIHHKNWRGFINCLLLLYQGGLDPHYVMILQLLLGISRVNLRTRCLFFSSTHKRV